MVDFDPDIPTIFERLLGVEELASGLPVCRGEQHTEATFPIGLAPEDGTIGCQEDQNLQQGSAIRRQLLECQACHRQ